MPPNLPFRNATSAPQKCVYKLFSQGKEALSCFEFKMRIAEVAYDVGKWKNWSRIVSNDEFCY